MERAWWKGPVLGAVALVVAFLLINSWLAHRNITRLNDAVGEVIHTQEAVDALNDVLITVLDAETGQRGYLIVGEPAYLEPYYRAVAAMPGQLDRLTALTADDPEQQQRSVRLGQQVAARLDVLKRIVALRQRDAEAARRALLGGDGKPEMDAVRATVAEMEEVEKARLAFRKEHSDYRYTLALTSELLALLVGLGMVVAFMALLRHDAQARARAAEIIHAQGELFRTTLASIGDAVITTDNDSRVTFLNAVAEALTGWPQAEACGRPLAEVFPIIDEETRQPGSNPALRALREGKVVGLANHTLLVARDGSERPIDDSAAPIRDEQGKVAGVVLVFRDVTDRRQAERQLREEARVSEALHRVGRLVAAELDLDHLVQTATDEATRLTDAQFGAFFNNVSNETGESYSLYALAGAPREAFTEFPMPRNTALFAPTFSGAAVVRLDDVTGDPRYGQNPPHQGMPPGHPPVRSYLAVPVIARNGTVLGGLFFGHERAGVFTERHERLLVGVAAQTASAIDNARLYQNAKRLSEHLQQRNAELAAADRHKNEFLAMLAHELRNPMAPIRNALHVLGMPGADAAILEQARSVMGRQIHHLVRLVDDLLDVSRIIRGRVELRKERVDLAAVVGRALETVQPLLDAKQHQLAVDLPAQPTWLDADPVRLAQVLSNLLTNAAKYTDQNGRIWLSGAAEGSHAVLRVRDNGIGISAELLPSVFDLFTQADRSLDRSQGGLGVGLTLCRHLVEMHGGSIRARSAGLGQGSEFEVRLPAALADRAARAAPTTAPGGTPAAGQRVLVVDDNVDAAASLAMLLRLQGNDVHVVHDGPHALEAATALRPQVVLLDIGLPGMDGLEVARQLRQLPECQDVLLVAVTGYGQDEDRQRSHEAGFDCHLVKPVNPGDLQELLAKLVQEPSS